VARSEAWIKVRDDTWSRIFTFDGATFALWPACPLALHGLLPNVAPVVSAATANAAPTGSGSVTISGLSFDAAGTSATASLTAADACGSSAWTSATTVLCAPAAYGRSAKMRTVVSVAATAGTLTGQFSFDGARRATSMLVHLAVNLRATLQRHV
jgi:hypothetical protein